MKRIIIIGSAVLLSGCVVEPARTYYSPQQPYYPQDQQYQPQQYQQQQYQPQQYQQQQYEPQQYQQQPFEQYQESEAQPVVSVYVDPPLVQPAPVLVAWAPPPMLVESPPPMPYEDAIWTGGYWVWEGNWVWAHGRWASPPRPGYGWVNPYYEHRDGSVVFVNGFWAAPGVTFVAPPRGISISVGIVSAGVIAGPRCRGPEGVFVPPPPGSHRGLIVPAPIGTSPAVVTGAPPIINQGMHITGFNGNGRHGNEGNERGRVNIVAPPGSTANGQAVNSAVPVQPHLAAAMTPVVHAYAPDPVSNRPIPAYVAGRQPAVLPQAQPVHNGASSTFSQPHNYSQQPEPYIQHGAPQSAVPDNRVQPAEPKPQQFDPRQPYEPRQQQVDPRQPYEPRQQQVDPRQQYEPRQQQVEQKPQPYEQRPQPVEQRSPQHEQRPQQYDPRSQPVEQRPQQIEQRPQPVEQKPQQQVQQKTNPAPVPQPKEKKEGSDKKPNQEHDRQVER